MRSANWRRQLVPSAAIGVSGAAAPTAAILKQIKGGAGDILLAATGIAVFVVFRISDRKESAFI